MVVGVAAVLLLVGAPACAHASVDVSRDGASGAIRVASTDGVPARVVLARGADGSLRVSDAAGVVTSADASCTAAAVAPAPGSALACTAPAGTAVTVALGAGADQLDTTAATGVVLTIDAGAGADVLRVGSSGTTRLDDVTAADVVDLSHAQDGVRVRYEPAVGRLVARCGGCPTPWAVVLPAAPGRVLLGPGPDDVDLGAWRTRRTTTWLLGADRDRFFGAPAHRSVVDAGAGWDTLVSRAAVDVLRGGAGFDKLADLGGAGDVLQGGADTDSIASLDGRRDTIDGGAGRDLCLTARGGPSGCDTGPVRSVETAQYVPAATQASVFAALNIR